MAFVVRSIQVSLNGYYGLRNRLRMGLDMTHQVGDSKEYRRRDKSSLVAGWLMDLAKCHDPQPDREFSILGEILFFILCFNSDCLKF